MRDWILETSLSQHRQHVRVYYAFKRKVTRSEMYLAVWMHGVQSNNRSRGWLKQQDELELIEAVEVFRRAEHHGQRIPSMDEAVDYYNNG